jgi:hypothetical protein
MRRSWWRSAACAGVMTAVAVGTAAGGGAATGADDEQIAEAGVLVASDFPAGWTSSPSDSSNGDEVEEVAAGIPSCKRYLSLRATGKKQARAESDSFEAGDSQIENSVAVFSSQASANAAMKLVRHSTMRPCVQELFTQVYEDALASDPRTRDAVTDIAVDIEASDLQDVGDATRTYEGAVVITLNDGSTQTVGVGLAAVRSGRAISLYTYVVDSEEVLQLLPTLVDESIARLGTALA